MNRMKRLMKEKGLSYKTRNMAPEPAPKPEPDPEPVAVEPEPEPEPEPGLELFAEEDDA